MNINVLPCIACVQTFNFKSTFILCFILGLTDGTFTAQFPLEKDLPSHKSEAFNVIQVIYENQNPVQNWFQCSICKELLYVKRKFVTQPLLRHECVKDWKAKKERDGRRLFQINVNQLCDVLAKILSIGFSNGPVDKQKILPILPKNSTSEQWYALKSLKYFWSLFFDFDSVSSLHFPRPS